MSNSRSRVRALAVFAAFGAMGCMHAPASGVTYLDQGWSDADRRFFYHTTQGTRIVPLPWFQALEQKDRAAPFAASDYAERYRFLSDNDPRGNPELLPVGFAKDIDADTHETYIGLTCAACHTAEITYRGATVRVDGGPAHIDVVAFTANLLGALAATAADPERFSHFARTVLQGSYDEASGRALRAQIQRTLEAAQREAGAKGAGAINADFGRLDALGRAGNLLLGQIDPSNLRPNDAPVSYPCLWDAWDYDWVQWNGSIAQPMARNIGEALGVGAHLAVSVVDKELRVHTSVRVDNLHGLEEELRKLKAPAWPESILGSIDRGRAARGKDIYVARCASCHEPELAPANEAGKRFFMAKMVPLEQIGTDPTQARSFHDRTAVTGNLGLGTISVVQGLQLISSDIREAKYDEYGLSPEQRIVWDGFRANEWRAPLAYRARSLRGIWATAPYLHNGSVASLYELLLPEEQRSRRFAIGNSEFDPKRVGFRLEPSPGSFEFMTEGTGNSNAGHEFRDGPAKSGVLGPAIAEEDRWDLVEYLKTL